MLTVIHVTHEAVHHLGGIGTVLQGLMTSRDYRARVGRSILVGPLGYADQQYAKPVDRLGEDGVECYYSGLDHHDPLGLGAILQPIEWAFGVNLFYGLRTFHAPGDDANTAPAEVLLVDVRNPDRDRLALMKWFMFDKHGIDSTRYEHSWDFEEYTRLAGPAYHALCALLPMAVAQGSKPSRLPAVLIAHEFMGVPTALRACTDRERFRTLFHAHECSTARRLTENLPGFDAAFYPAMNRGIAEGKCVGEVFGDQYDFGRHALVERTHVLDGNMAVGPETGAELKFLSPAMRSSRTRVVYNGLPSRPVTFAERQASRGLVNEWLKNTLGSVPDYLITHVTRPVPSKGLWRDLALLKHLEPLLRAKGKTAAYVLLTCGAHARSEAEVNDMVKRYGWPRAHQEGYPDLVGPEVDLYRDIVSFNAAVEKSGGKPAISATLVNQFGFSRQRLGPAAPMGVTTGDLRRAADVELGMSTYEPFGIAQLEPLHAGAVCVTSDVCGCMGLVKRAMSELGMASCDLVLPADFAGRVPGGTAHPERMSVAERLKLEDEVCRELAAKLAERLPTTEAQQRAHLELGQKLAKRMSWDHVVTSDFIPALEAALARS